MPLHEARIRQISGDALSDQGCTFTCHKTGGSRGQEVHCAGALAYAAKQGRQNQPARIASRLGLYDPAAIAEATRAAVWDSEAEWLEHGQI